MTKQIKLKAVFNSPEVIAATKLMCVCMKDIKAKNFIHAEYYIDEEPYVLAFIKDKRIKSGIKK